MVLALKWASEVNLKWASEVNLKWASEVNLKLLKTNNNHKWLISLVKVQKRFW